MKTKQSNFHIFLIISLFITGILPSILSFAKPIGEDLENTFALGGGINAVDVVLLIMFGIVLLKTFLKRKSNQIKDRYLYNLIVLFTIWILFEIFRNISNYGLSAPGEFRFRYLILALPLFIAIYYDNKIKREVLISIIIFFSFFVPLLLIPFIGFIKGWQFGAQNRFLNSQIHLGMLYGYTSLILLKKYKQIKFNNFLFALISIPYFFFFIVDSHRSVWLAAVVIIVTLYFLKEIRFKKVVYLIPVGIFLFFILFMLLKGVGIDFWKYVTERGIAFINPQEDNTAKWRLLIWQAQLVNFFSTPLLGQGFGGYWSVYVPELGTIDVSPHNFYVQSLVKIGSIGLLLYLSIIFRIMNKLIKAYKLFKLKKKKELPLVLLGLVILIAAHVYYSVYSLEYYSLMFIGLAVAVIRDKSNFA